MSKRPQSRTGHVWRWHDEDPEAIVVLVLIIAAIIALPWRGCGPISAQGEPHPVAEVARPIVEDLQSRPQNVAPPAPEAQDAEQVDAETGE